jgi:hypothetical protein
MKSSSAVRRGKKEEPAKFVVSVNWEVKIEFFPAQVREKGYDFFFNRVADGIYAKKSSPLSSWGYIGASGHFERYMILDVVPHETRTMHDFQDSVVEFLVGLKIEAWTLVRRTVVVMLDD